MRTNSSVMSVCKKIGCNRLAWALRRLHCPVPKHALVLEVGSGGNPYPRANVLLDAYEATKQRHWVPLKNDRPLVLGFVENLPFQDKAFDFVIASHVLEHSCDPERFLSELQRVAKAGYIEVPDAFLERINPYLFHRLEISVRGGALIIRKKKRPVPDKEIVELYEHKAKKYFTSMLFTRQPELFHVRYYWQNKIDYVVVNPEIDCSWDASKDAADTSHCTCKTNRERCVDMVRKLLSQNKRNNAIDLLDVLACPVCRSGKLIRSATGITCIGCSRTYKTKNKLLLMIAGDGRQQS
jgi:SAM-dependent methyltransferase